MKTFRMITQAFEEISVMRMQRIRNSVLNTRSFLDQLAQVYIDIKGNYRVSMMSILTGKKKDVQEFLGLNKNGKDVNVLISTNTRLSGEIVKKVFRTFLEYVNKHPDDDIVLVGRQGKQMFDALGTGRKYEYYEFKENEITTDGLKDIILGLYQYKIVRAFFGKFESLVTQNPNQSTLTGNEEEGKNQDDMKVTPYMFEPSIESILTFFDTQIFSSLVKQTVNESELARYASRIRAMEEATGHIDKTKSEYERLRRKMRQLVMNKKQLQTVSAAMRLT